MRSDSWNGGGCKVLSFRASMIGPVRLAVMLEMTARNDASAQPRLSEINRASDKGTGIALGVRIPTASRAHECEEMLIAPMRLVTVREENNDSNRELRIPHRAVICPGS